MRSYDGTQQWLLDLWQQYRQEKAQVQAEQASGGSGSGCGDEWDDQSRAEYSQWSDEVNRQHESEADEAWAAEELERMQREDEERRCDR